MINLSQYKVIGLLFDTSITQDELLKCITEIQVGNEDFTPVIWRNHNIATHTIDTESAQKYGKFDQLQLSKLVMGLGSSVTNFYYEYDHINHKDHSCNDKGACELIEYVNDQGGYLFFLGQVPNSWINFARRLNMNYCKLFNTAPRRFNRV